MPLKFEEQDFVVLKQRCLAQKCLFEDHVFPAGVQVLASHELSHKTKIKAIMWKRPKVGMEGMGLQQPALGEQEAKWSRARGHGSVLWAIDLSRVSLSKIPFCFLLKLEMLFSIPELEIIITLYGSLKS